LHGQYSLDVLKYLSKAFQEVCMNSRITFKLGLLVMLVVGSALAQAATFVAMTDEELIQQSDAVVQGQVIRLESKWDPQGRIIVTEATIQVSETIAGVAPSQIVVQTPGGKVNDYRVEALGFPSLNNGEEVILFIKDDQSLQVSRIVGHQQGHFEVVKRLDGVTLAVPRIEDGASFLTPSGKAIPAPRSTELAAFKGRVRAEAARVGKPVKQ
jgi:hypothetical protein